MATARGKKKTSTKDSPRSEKDRAVRILRVNKDDDIKTLYAKVRKAFTASDLQCFAQDEVMMPAEDLATELESMAREDRKRKKRAEG